RGRGRGGRRRGRRRRCREGVLREGGGRREQRGRDRERADRRAADPHAPTGAGAERVNGKTIASTTATEPAISAITAGKSQFWETPRASELLSACKAIQGRSEPVR